MTKSGGIGSLHEGGALSRKGSRTATRQCRLRTIPQRVVLPSARRGGYDGEIYQVQRHLQETQRHRVTDIYHKKIASGLLPMRFFVAGFTSRRPYFSFVVLARHFSQHVSVLFFCSPLQHIEYLHAHPSIGCGIELLLRSERMRLPITQSLRLRHLFPDFVIVSPKSLRQRVLLFSDVLPSALFGCKSPCSEVA